MNTSILIFFIYFLVVPAIFMFCFIWLVRDIRRTRWLEQNGTVCQARIVSLLDTGNTRPRFFFVTYEFRAEDDKHQESLYINKHLIGWKTYKRLKSASEVTINYSADDPKFSRLSARDADHTDRLYAIYVGLSVAIIWFGLLFNFLARL
jgi:hypothetical protein